MTVANKFIGISFHRVFFWTGSLAIIAAVHHIRRRFEIFDQMTFEIKRSVSHLDDAIRFTNSSGADVQNAKMVSQITIGGIPNLLATLLLHQTNISHHHINEISHNIINNAAKITHNCH